MIRRPPRSTQSRSSAASDVYKRDRLHECLGVVYPHYSLARVKVAVGRAVHVALVGHVVDRRLYVGGLAAYVREARCARGARPKDDGNPCQNKRHRKDGRYAEVFLKPRPDHNSNYLVQPSAKYQSVAGAVTPIAPYPPGLAPWTL